MTPAPSEPPEGRLRPLGPGALVGCAVAGLVAGWLVHPVAVRLGHTPPVVAWSQGVILLAGAAVLVVAARGMARAVASRQPLDAQRAVNRLALARACALLGALTAGGYAGYAISWLGDGSEMLGTRLATSGFAAVAGVAFLIAALWLERACRVRSDAEEP